MKETEMLFIVVCGEEREMEVNLCWSEFVKWEQNKGCCFRANENAK